MRLQSKNVEVLEIGCGSGGNVLPMAESLPESRFLGIDLCQAEIDAGRAVAEKIGLQNMKFNCMDVRDLDGGASYDYVILHGVYCWTDENLQHEVLERSRQLLAENGVLYLNLSTYPGWNFHSMLQTVLKADRREKEDTGRSALRARRTLDELSSSLQSDSSPWATLVRQQLGQQLQRSDEFLYQAFLNIRNRPVYFSEFCQAARHRQLQYVGDADPAIQWSELLYPDIQARIDRMTENELLRQQYWDIVLNRSSRYALLCHTHHDGASHQDYGVLSGCFVTANDGPPKRIAGRGEEVIIEFSRGRRLGVVGPFLCGIIQQASEKWPCSVSLAEHGDTVDDVSARTLLTLFASGLISLTTLPVPCAQRLTDRPRTTAYVRHQAEVGSGVTNLKHQFLKPDEIDLALLKFLDGTTDFAGLIRRFNESGEAEPVSETELRRRLQRFVQHALLLSEVLD